MEYWVEEASLPSCKIRRYFVFGCIPKIPIFHHSNVPGLSPPSEPRVDGVPQPLSQKIKGENSDENSQPRENRQPPSVKDIGPSLCKNIPPAWGRGLNTKPEKTQTRLYQYR